MTDTGSRGDPKTDAPPLDVPTQLRARRDEFVQTFFKKGAELTGELVDENDRLHRAMTDLETENAALRRQLASDTAIRDLLSKIHELEKEKNALLARQSTADAVSHRFTARFSAIEEELAMLANVYVASYQLNATLRLPLVVRHIHELLGQLVGSRSHAIYLLDEPRGELVPIATEGLGSDEVRAIRIGQASPGDSFSAAIERVFLTGVSLFAEDPHEAPEREPPACVPLRVDDRIVGVIVIHTMLGQKLTFMPVDFELFKLLSAHAGTAIFGAQLYEAAGRKVPSPQSIASSSRLASETGASRDKNRR